MNTEIAVVLFVASILSLLFTLKTHRQLIESKPGKFGPSKAQVEVEQGRWSKGIAITYRRGRQHSGCAVCGTGPRVSRPRSRTTEAAQTPMNQESEPACL